MPTPTVEERIIRIELLLQHVVRGVDETKTLLLGKDGEPGMVVRLDRLEQNQARQGRMFWILVSAFVAAGLKLFLG